jgi:TonB-linked SusC/RagA family outer membrane protein
LASEPGKCGITSIIFLVTTNLKTKQMYKIYTKQTGITAGYIHKFLLIMRLTTVILIATLMHVSAAGLAQKISISKKNVPLKSVLKELRNQSGYDFVFTENLLQQAAPVNINVNGVEIEEVLQSIFSKQPLKYTIRDKTVVISAKEPSIMDRVVDFFKDIVVNGTVTDENGKAVAGVTVSIKGSNKKTTTDAEGKFSITANKQDDVLVFTSIMTDTQEIDLANRTQLTVSLKTKTNLLQEVSVNTGFQTIAKQRMTGATVTVGSEEIAKRYNTNIINSLEGRVPGLVNYRGTTTIRGVSTINASRAVLVVLDGLPIEGSIANVNPYDVESVTVLKDAAAAAIYGARAANGVIVITTKKAKGGRTTIDFAADVTLTEKPDLSYNMLTPAQQVDLENSYYSNYYTNIAGTIANTATAINRGDPITPVQYAWYQKAQNQITQAQLDNRLNDFRQNDFRQQYTDNALLSTVLQQYDLSVRTDGNKYNSSLILNYKTTNSGIINAYNRQLNIFYKGTYQFSKWLDVNFGVNGILGKAKASASSFATSANNVSPYLQLLDASGNRMYYTTGDYNMYNANPASMPKYSMNVNHLDELEQDQRLTKQNYTRYFANLNLRILPGLTFSPQFQYESLINNSSNYSEPDSYIMRYLKNVYYKVPQGTTPETYKNLLPENGGKLATTNSTGDYWTARGQLSYRKAFGKHGIDLSAGTEFRQTRDKGTNGLLLGYDDQLQSQSTTTVNYPALFAYNTSQTFKPNSSTTNLYNTYLNTPIGLIPEITHRTNSGYAVANYSYDNKYAASGSYRIDYADVFGLDKRFRGKPLYSAGLAWNISNEEFMSAQKWIDFLKLRTSYGITGNMSQDVTSFLTASSTLPPNAATNAPVSVVTNAANPELRWEKSATFNVGLDFALLNKRLTGALDWYRKKSTDLLFTQRIDPSEGFTSQIINNGGLVNNGIELSLAYSWTDPTKVDGIQWSSTLVLSHNKNKITYVDEVSVLPIPLVQGGYRVGYPVNSLYSFQYKGLNNLGQPQWLKADGTLSTVALTGSDMNAIVYSGGTDPINNIALTNEVYYKGFSLNILAVYFGGQYLRGVYPEIYAGGLGYSGGPSYLLDSWTPGNTTTIVPGYGQYSPGTYPGTSVTPSNHLRYSDTFVYSGDFIKIRNVTLGYQLPAKLAHKLGSKGVGLRFQLNNPKSLWVNNDVNIDPETGGARTLTSYVFGLNFNL